ncbi:MAG: acyl carrier protein [Lachnospiraceae bacterium]|nr:acyl carrier protein [Lachnospiraceae bacterium]
MLDKITEIITEQLNVTGIEITEETSIKDDLGVDSLDLLELIMAFESEYGVEIPPEDLEGVNTVGDIMEYISKKEAE